MAKTIQEERLRWVLPIVEGRNTIAEAMKSCVYGQRSLERWLAAYRQGGEEALIPHSTRPKSHPQETPLRIRRAITDLRHQQGWCAKKLTWELHDQGIAIHERTVGKILKREGLVRTYRVKRVKYKYLRAERQPGELMEIDVKHVPGPIVGRKYYQFTAIDCGSRWRLLLAYEDETSYNAIRFLAEVIWRFPYRIQAIKTDNGAIFTNYYTGTNKRSDQTVKQLHALDVFCRSRGIVHYLIDPGKPAQNGMVERSHREDQEKFYERQTFRSYAGLQKKLAQWNTEYNNLRHCGLGGKTPNQILVQHPLTNPPKVCA